MRAPTAEDRQRITAERLIVEAKPLVAQGSTAQRAIEKLEQALALWRELGERYFEARTLYFMGRAYSSLSRQEKAIEYLEQSLAIYRELKNRQGEVGALNYLGVVHHRLSRYEKAIEYLGRALQIARDENDRADEGAVLNSLGNAYREMSQYEKAIECYEQSLFIARQVEDRQGEAAALTNLANVYRNLGRYERAIESFELGLLIVEYSEQALVIARELKERRDEASALSSLAEAERDRGNLTRARGLIEEGLQITESLRSEIYNQQSRATYFASVQGYSELYIDLLMRLHKANPAGGFDALALEANERARARGLLELLTEAGADIRQGVDGALLERERTLASQLNAKAASQVQLLSKPHTPERAGALRKEISQLENDYEHVQAQVRRSSPRYAALTQPQPLGLKQVQQQLDRDTLLLEYSLGEDRSYVWAITNSSLTSYELPKEAQVKGAGTQVLDLLTIRGRVMKGETSPQKQQRIAQAEAQLPPAARQLSQMLLGPVANQLGSKRLVIVADGALQYLPFAMLPEPLDSERPSLSALVLSMVDEQGKPQDGFLRANEIYNLNLPAELVVLSACQTGLGKEIKGEGLIGLTRGFMYAGAARVVVSLWSVNDKATSELMAKFYQKMLKENQRPAAALRAAQVELWKQKQWQSPYYWAAFVLQGEWR